MVQSSARRGGRESVINAAEMIPLSPFCNFPIHRSIGPKLKLKLNRRRKNKQRSRFSGLIVFNASILLSLSLLSLFLLFAIPSQTGVTWSCNRRLLLWPHADEEKMMGELERERESAVSLRNLNKNNPILFTLQSLEIAWIPPPGSPLTQPIGYKNIHFRVGLSRFRFTIDSKSPFLVKELWKESILF